MENSQYGRPEEPHQDSQHYLWSSLACSSQASNTHMVAESSSKWFCSPSLESGRPVPSNNWIVNLSTVSGWLLALQKAITSKHSHWNNKLHLSQRRFTSEFSIKEQYLQYITALWTEHRFRAGFFQTYRKIMASIRSVQTDTGATKRSGENQNPLDVWKAASQSLDI
jgi:hypothetical protein